MSPTPGEPPNKPRKSAFQRIHEQVENELRPLRKMEDIQNLARHYASDYPARELAKQSDLHRQIQEIRHSYAVPKPIQDYIDCTSAAVQAKLATEKYSLMQTHADLDINKKAIWQTTALNDSMTQATSLELASSVAKQYERHLRLASQPQELLEQLGRQSFGGLTARDFASQLAGSNSAFHAIQEARKSLDRLLPMFRGIDFKNFEPSEEDEQETNQAAESIARTVAGDESIQKAFERIVIAIQAEKRPAVQLRLWLIFCKVIDWLVAGAIGVYVGHIAPVVLGESPQAAKKEIQAIARVAVGSAEILAEYRYVSAKVLIVRQNPKARSPEVGRLPFGRALKLLKKEKDFALVLWTDKDSGSVIQGWVFSRYLSKFK